jgi:putative redox protein
MTAQVAVADRVVVRYREGDRYEIGIRGHWLMPEQPVNASSANGGPTPTEVVVASLANAVAHYAGRFLDRHGLTRNGLRVTADFDLTSGRSARVAAVRMNIRVPHVLSGEHRHALLVAVSHCTLDDSLARRPPVHVDLTDGVQP